MRKRIVITGLGVVSSIGIGKVDFWSALVKGRSGITPISSFDSVNFPVHNAGEIKDFHPEKYIPAESINNLGRASCFAAVAAKLALDDAGIKNLAPEKTAVCMGTTMGESQILEKLNSAWMSQGIDSVDARMVTKYPCNMLALNLSERLGLKGPSLVIPNACAAGNFAIGYACDLINLGEIDSALVGGSDAFSRIAFTGFSRMFAVAPDKCQPFDKNRKGMMVAEGAGMVILETLENALKRNAPIYAEVLGYGISCDARHMTAPWSEGIKEAIANALLESKVEIQEVDYISAHGTGTANNDKEECGAIKKVFGDRAKSIPTSSVKSMLGHTMGAASAIEALTCCLAIKNDIVPPTINYETPDPDCDIDCVPNEARKLKVNIALNNASAFGGNNSCLVLKKYSA